MGLFNRTKYQCAICGKDTMKSATDITETSGDLKICPSCDNKVNSIKVDSGVRIYNGKRCYYKFGLKEMKQMQDFFEEAKKRAELFVKSYTIEHLCIDKEHGWFFMDKKVDYNRNSSKGLNLSRPLEIYSVNDVKEIYCIGDIEDSIIGSIMFHFKKDILPYDHYSSDNTIFFSKNFFESKNKYILRTESIIRDLSNLFPDAKLSTPKERTRQSLLASYAAWEKEIDNLIKNRLLMNNEIDSSFAPGKLPDKYKPLAKQYLELDNLLSSEIELLRDVNNFSTDFELKEHKDDATLYLSKMLTIYSKIKGF